MAKSQILFYVHQQPMISDHGTQYEGNPSSHHGGMFEDGLTDGRTAELMARQSGPIPIFPNSIYAE